MDDHLLDEKQRWEKETLEPAIQKFPERHERFETSSEIELERMYLPRDLDYPGQLGFPGEYPFTRGVHPTMYRGRLWTMRQYAGYASAAESNVRYR